MFNLNIYYGNNEKKIDVTDKLINYDVIPALDNERVQIIQFDPLPFIEKSIFINNIEFKSGSIIDLNLIKKKHIYCSHFSTYGLHNINTIFDVKDAYHKVIIGKFCSIGINTNIFLGANHRTDFITTYPFGHIYNNIFKCDGIGHPKSNGDVIIGNDVWIGLNSTIMSGIKIGDGAVIAANSVVVKNVENYSIVGGNPAKHIKFRFKKNHIEKLIEIKWWNHDISKINNNMNLLFSNKIDEFIENFNL